MVLYVVSTLLQTLRKMVLEDPKQARILLGLVVLSYVVAFRSVLKPLASLMFLLLKLLFALIITRPYKATGMILLMVAKRRYTGKTHATLVAIAMLFACLGSPGDFSADTARVSQFSNIASDLLSTAHDSLRSDAPIAMETVLGGFALPESVDSLKIACLGVVVLAALRQSRTNPRPTMLRALVS